MYSLGCCLDGQGIGGSILLGVTELPLLYRVLTALGSTPCPHTIDFSIGDKAVGA
jgi:hypothetical protein